MPMPRATRQRVGSDADEDQLAPPEAPPSGSKRADDSRIATEAKDRTIVSRAPPKPKARGRIANAKSKPPGTKGPTRSSRNSIDDAPSEGDFSSVPQMERKANNKRKAADEPKSRPAKTVKRHVPKGKDGEFEFTPTGDRTSNRPRRSIAGQKVAGHEMNLDDAKGAESSHKLNLYMSDTEMNLHRSPISFPSQRDSPKSHTKSNSATIRRRPGSASDEEQIASDGTLKHRIGDLTRKLENMEHKYNELRSLRIVQAEVNYENLRKQSEANSRAASDLINALKRELAAHKSISAETLAIQSAMDSRDVELNEARLLVEKLSTDLADTQAENATLQVKLTSVRSQGRSDELASSRTPGSVVRKGGTRNEGAQTAEIAQLKEDLYADLTGLILRAVNVDEDDYMFDCLQTGRNGTLHFQLAVAKESESFAKTEFQYTPRLDTDRDRELLELLPDYLSEGIAFVRGNAPLFYGRIVDTLMKRRPMDL